MGEFGSDDQEKNEEQADGPQSIWKTICDHLISNTAKDLTLIANFEVLNKDQLNNKDNISKLEIQFVKEGKYSAKIGGEEIFAINIGLVDLEFKLYTKLDANAKIWNE